MLSTSTARWSGCRRCCDALIGEHIGLVTRLAPSLHDVFADPGQLEQVVMNLAINARDAMPNGGQLVIDTANVTFGTADLARKRGGAGDFVRVTISDTGLGMEEAVRARLFEPFFTTKARGRGTGLGLSTGVRRREPERRLHLGRQRTRTGHDVHARFPARRRGDGRCELSRPRKAPLRAPARPFSSSRICLRFVP